MKIYLLLSTILCAFVNPAYSQWYVGEGENRRLADPSPSRGSVGDFGAQVVITDDPEGFFTQWNQPPSPDYKPTISPVSNIRRGDIVMAVVMFHGCAPNSGGNCISELDFKVVNPDGSIYGEHSGELWSNKPSIPKGSVQVSVDNLSFKVEPDDQFGEYRIEVLVRDLVTDTEIKLVGTVTVVGDSEDGT